MSRQSQAKQPNPLILSVLGLICVVFGVTDLFIDRVWIGIFLIAVGLLVGVNGIRRYAALKKRLRNG
ncbi:hypothetical protein [Cohnella herbarum]|uniref:Uncharacterized protein n=1 Tax=Cohnella herbarum TaxID=2728023 RepID=A0A7Z2VF87_9BACL|nr:hypothetical protein [Cohnella herbarum]QJD82037.1 hypothetical protein HH215_01785 [Cohnella herbarum]